MLGLLCSERFGGMSTLELQDARCLLVPDTKQLTIQDLLLMKTLHNLVASVEGQWLNFMIKEQRLITYFQPIVEVYNPNNILAYECLIRGQELDGTITYPDRMFSIAKAADTLFQLDRSARITAIRDATKCNLQQKVFINFIPAAIYDPSFCLRTTVAAIEQSCMKNEQFVFEVVESEDIDDITHLLKILEFYRSNGFQVALDDLGAGYSSLNLLHKIRPDYIKLDRELVHGVDVDPYKAQISAMLLSLANELGIKTIAEGVETVGEWQWLQENGTEYVQGYLFARPSQEPGIASVPVTG